jgi:hypothetical protein
MKAISKTVLSMTLSALALLVPARFTHASHFVESLPAWTHTASSCAVDDDTLNRYVVNAADFIHSPIHTGAIVARCNVVNPLDNSNPLWNTLIVGYQDPDGTGPAYQVVVRLLRFTSPHRHAAVCRGNVQQQQLQRYRPDRKCGDI